MTFRIRAGERATQMSNLIASPPLPQNSRRLIAELGDRHLSTDRVENESPKPRKS